MIDEDAVTCSFCGKVYGRPGDLVLGATVAVCRGCISAIRTVVGGGAPSDDSTGQQGEWRTANVSETCLFCYNDAPERRPVITRRKGRICAACIGICESCFEPADDGG